MSEKTHWAKTYRGRRFVPACSAEQGDCTIEPHKVTCHECRRIIKHA